MIQRTNSVDSTVVYTRPGTTDFLDFEKQEHGISKTRVHRIRSSVQRLVDGVEERSINTYIRTNKYMDNDLKKPAQRLKQVLRRSVHRTRYSRSLRNINKKSSRRFDEMFTGTDPVFSSDTELARIHKENLAQSEAQVIKDLEEEKEQQRQASLEILIEGNIEQLKIKGIGRIWKKRYGVLNSEGLRYFDSKEDFHALSRPVGEISFGDLVATKGNIAESMVPRQALSRFERPYIFILSSEGEKLCFAVRKNGSLGKWVHCLNNAFKGFVYHKAKEEAIKSPLSDTWVSRQQWGELQKALKNPSRKNAPIVRENIKLSLLDYLDKLVTSRVNLNLLQVTFLAWKTMVNIRNKEKKNVQLLYLGKRHSAVFSESSNNLSQLGRTPKLGHKGSNRRLKERQKSRGFGLEVDKEGTHNTMEIKA